MTDIVERATRAIFRAAEAGTLDDPGGAQRALRAVLVALQAPDRDMVDAAEALGFHASRGEAAALWIAMVKSLKARCEPLSSLEPSERQQPDRSDPHRPAAD